MYIYLSLVRNWSLNDFLVCCYGLFWERKKANFLLCFFRRQESFVANLLRLIQRMRPLELRNGVSKKKQKKTKKKKVKEKDGENGATEEDKFDDAEKVPKSEDLLLKRKMFPVIQ